MNPPILATRNLGLDIGGATIVADVSLEVAEGELLGIIGPNGAGKTSLFNLFSGLYRPTSGSIRLNGVDITHQPTYLRTREGIGRTFQVSSVFPLLTTFENVRLAAQAALGGTLRLWQRASGVRKAVDGARAALARVGLEAKAGVPAGGLSHGDKRRLEIAMLLAADKPVLLLDEPMAGLSAEHVPRARGADPLGARGGAEDGAHGRAPHGGRDGDRATHRGHASRRAPRRATRPPQ